MSKLLLDLYQKIFLIREAEIEICKEYHNDEMKTPMHMSMGEEAIAVGVCTALGNRAQIWGTYRSHAIYLARTEDVNGFFAELYGKATGSGGGRAGSMHLADSDRGVMMTSAVVATNISPALGGAFSTKTLDDGKINVAFFGDGATDEGAFWESINIACLWHLPIIFVCEDNDLAIHAPTSIRRGYKNLINIISQYNFSCIEEYDGTDAEIIYNLTHRATKYLEDGPVFLSLKYYRYLEHVGINEDFNAGYRTREEFLEWEKKDPIKIQRQKLLDAGYEDAVIKIEGELTEKIRNAVTTAKEAPYPEPLELYRGVFDGE